MQGEMKAQRLFVRTTEDLFYAELGQKIWVSIDNVFVFSNTVEKHVQDVTHDRSKLQHTGYYAKPKKCVFCTIRLDILSHMIHDDGIHARTERIRTIIDCTTLETQKELLRFNGIGQLYGALH